MSIGLFIMVLFPLCADVVFLKTGEVVLGTIMSVSSGSVSIRSLSTERQINATQILHTEKGLSALADFPLEVQLKDGTVIRGVIIDYDEEIGVFVDISFGNLVLPILAIEMISDPVQSRRNADRKHLVVMGAAYTLPLSDSFDSGLAFSLGLDMQTPFVRGLFWGGDLSYSFFNYSESSLVSYFTVGLNVALLYKPLALAVTSPMFAVVLPYGRLATGAVLVQVNDDRPEASITQRGLLTSEFAAEVGLEWHLPASSGLRSFAAFDFIFQEDAVFIVPGFGLSYYYSF
jgi:hypothetical protein